MPDLFETNPAELNGLRDKLDGNDQEPRKDAVKRVIALMRAGENLKPLFSSMLRCVKTADHELKRLVYIYLLNYCNREPEQAIMAVAAFITDAQDANPFVRSLAVRTMCRIRLESVAEHMVQPLKRALADADPYVRKTAAYGVAKLHEVLPDAVVENQLIEVLRGLVKDENAGVVANAIAALYELAERGVPAVLGKDELSSVVAAAAEGSEWCQAVMFDTLAAYRPNEADAATTVVERLIPFLKARNCAVVIGCFRSILHMQKMSTVGEHELFPQVLPQFMTLVSTGNPEVCYVVLRALSLFTMKYPHVLSKEIRTFFCKYNDPTYVKMEKLEIMTRVCTPANVGLVLDELTEYAAAVDVPFVRKAIAGVGQVALKVAGATARAVDILVNLIGGHAEYAVEEAVIVMSDILRKYPGEFESILAQTCAQLDKVKDARAKAAGIWMLGEYAEVIDGVDLLIDHFVDSFNDEVPSVQLHILTALAKLYVKKPDDARDQLQAVLNEAMKDSAFPDVRNRALIYWRVLSSDCAAKVLVFPKVMPAQSDSRYAPEVVDVLLGMIGSVAGILHVLPGDFVSRVDFVREEAERSVEEEEKKPVMPQGPRYEPLHLNDDTLLEASVGFDRGHIYLRLEAKSKMALTGLAIAVNHNALGLQVTEQPAWPAALMPGASIELVVPIAFASAAVGNPGKASLEVALRVGSGMVFGVCPLPVEYALQPKGRLTELQWREVVSSSADPIQVSLRDSVLLSAEELNERQCFVLGRAENRMFFAFALVSDVVCAGEAAQVGNDVMIRAKVTDKLCAQLIQRSLKALMVKG